MLSTGEGVYELHWQRREYGELSLQLYARTAWGQLRLLDALDLAPFDGAVDLVRWLVRQLALDTELSS